MSEENPAPEDHGEHEEEPTLREPRVPYDANAPDEMVTLSFELPRWAAEAIRADRKESVALIRLAAASMLYGEGRVSQEVAAKVSGLSRAEFMRSVGTFRLSPFQYEDVEELLWEAGLGGTVGR